MSAAAAGTVLAPPLSDTQSTITITVSTATDNGAIAVGTTDRCATHSGMPITSTGKLSSRKPSQHDSSRNRQ
ncbi:hypothetical protein ABZ858_30120 [Streptomyces sp. NPDC047017]|uniref:hypothetical protein n=1 Tax=Streptomyces sp. NPDC047017 TaxID=3155024 RepID=UPI003400B2D2